MEAVEVAQLKLLGWYALDRGLPLCSDSAFRADSSTHRRHLASQLAAGFLICCPGRFELPGLGGVPFAIRPALHSEIHPGHSAEAALASEGPCVTAFTANARPVGICGHAV